MDARFGDFLWTYEGHSIVHRRDRIKILRGKTRKAIAADYLVDYSRPRVACLVLKAMLDVFLELFYGRFLAGSLPTLDVNEVAIWLQKEAVWCANRRLLGPNDLPLGCAEDTPYLWRT